MKKNVAGQTVAAQLIASADGSNVTTGTTTVYVLGDGGTQGAGSGTVTHEGNGLWSYVPTQAETNYDHVAFTFTNSSAITTTVQVYPSFPQTVDNATNITAIKTKTDFLPSATAGAAGGVFIAGTNAPVTITGSGDALTLSSTGGNGRGIYASGNGTGAGIRASGGATGDGITAISTAGNGISASSTSGRGISATGGTNNHGIYAAGTGTGSGLTTAGGLTGHGIYAAGGGTSGNGITATGLTSGHGMSLQGTGSSKHGLYAGGGASGTSDGIYATAGSGGVDIRGNITGNLTGTVSGIAGTITTLDALNTSLSSTHGAGSWETATGFSTLTTGDIPTTAQIADAVWDEALSGHATAGSTGAALSASGGASDPLLNTVPGSYASGTAGHALGRIGSARVTATSPVATGGDVTVTYGDDYYAADGRALDWTGTSTNIWPDLTSATITVYVDDGNLTITGSVVTPTGTQKVRCQPTAIETATLTPGVYDFDVKAALASSAHVVTLVRGKWTVTDSESV